MIEARLILLIRGLFRLQLCYDVVTGSNKSDEKYVDCMTNKIIQSVSVFAGPTNVEDSVQLLMKDAGKSKALTSLAGLITAIICYARCVQ